MIRTLSSKAALQLAALVLATAFSSVPAQAAGVTLNVSTCDSFSLSGQAPNQTLNCIVSNAPTGCTIQGPTTGTIGTPITLTAQCTTGAPTSWAWSGGGCGANTQSCLASYSGAPGTVSYSVTPSNGVGPGNTATTQVAWSNTAPAAPSGCTLSGTAVGATGGATTLTMSCTGGGSPTSYSWGSSPAASGLASTTTTGSQTATIAATTTFTATASNAGGGSQATTSVSVGTGGGGGGPLSCSGFTSTQVLDLDWNNPLIYVRTGSLSQTDAVVVRITTGPSGGYGKISGAEYAGSSAGRYATLSPTACDFGSPPALGWTASSIGNTVEVLFSNGPNAFGYPALAPNSTSYFNVKTTGACGSNCGMLFQLNKYQ